MTCRACTHGPRGSRGHLDLRAHLCPGDTPSREMASLRFFCSVCTSIWDRRAYADGYLWSLVSRAAVERV